MLGTALCTGALVLISLLVVSCGDTGPSGTVNNRHTINAVVARDAALSTLTAYVEVFRNDEPFPTVATRLFSTGLDTVSISSRGDGTFLSSVAPHLIRDTVFLQVLSVLDQFSFQQMIIIPDTFTVQITSPGSKILRGLGTVNIVWSPAKYASGYIIVVKPTNPASTAKGYVAFASQQATAGAIPASACAFCDINDNLVVGDYEIYVAAYQGSPIDYPGAKFDMLNFAANVNRAGVTGKTGAISISRKDVLTVETIP